jgi:hypothetical protein
VAISDGTRSGTAIDRGWMKPGRRSHARIEMVLKGKKSNDVTASERQVAAIGSQWEFFGSLRIRATD